MLRVSIYIIHDPFTGFMIYHHLMVHILELTFSIHKHRRGQDHVYVIPLSSPAAHIVPAFCLETVASFPSVFLIHPP